MRAGNSEENHWGFHITVSEPSFSVKVPVVLQAQSLANVARLTGRVSWLDPYASGWGGPL